MTSLIQECGGWASSDPYLDSTPCVCFDFKDLSIKFDAYTLQSTSKNWSGKPKSWTVEGSKDVIHRTVLEILKVMLKK